jgi:hypothetical protein
LKDDDELKRTQYSSERGQFGPLKQKDVGQKNKEGLDRAWSYFSVPHLSVGRRGLLP